jgi:hypothetical protein
MKFIDGNSVFPTKVISLPNPDDIKIIKELGYDIHENNQIFIYSPEEEIEITLKLSDNEIPYSLGVYIKNINEIEAEGIKFNSRSEIIKFLNDRVKPPPSREELEAELKSVKDALFTLMFGDVGNV